MGCREATFVDKSTFDFPIFLLCFNAKFPIFSIFSILRFLFSYVFEQPCRWTPWDCIFRFWAPLPAGFPEPLTSPRPPSPVRFSSMPSVVGVWIFSGIIHKKRVTSLFPVQVHCLARLICSPIFLAVSPCSSPNSTTAETGSRPFYFICLNC